MVREELKAEKEHRRKETDKHICFQVKTKDRTLEFQTKIGLLKSLEK